MSARNSPCPCGSGKKYKKCCLVTQQAEIYEDFSYRRSREIEAALIDRLYGHAAAVFGPTSIDEAWREFHCWAGSDQHDRDDPINQLFGPYFLFGWEIDPMDTTCDPSLQGKTIAESFMAANRSRLSVAETEILAAANRSVFTFFEIGDIRQGQGFTLRNVLTKEEHRVHEQLGSEGAKRGDVIFGAIMQIGHMCQTLAVSPYVLPPLTVRSLIDLRNRLQKRFKGKDLTIARLADVSVELRQMYFKLLESLDNPQPLQYTNTDGDPLVPQTLYFEINDPDEAFAMLKVLATPLISEEDLRSRAELSDGRIHEVEIPWFRKPKSTADSDSATVLARLKIVGYKMTAVVNSDKRAAAITSKIQSILGDSVRFKTKVIESVEANLTAAPKREDRPSKENQEEQLPSSAVEAIRKLADAHWAKWLDTGIPALNGMTPKKASTTVEGRELLEALLNYYDQEDQRESNVAANLFQPDLKLLRSKLGLK